MGSGEEEKMGNKKLKEVEGDEISSTQAQSHERTYSAYSCEAGSEKDDITDHDLDQWREHGPPNSLAHTGGENDREKENDRDGEKDGEKDKEKDGNQGEITICEHFRGELIKCLNKVALQSQVSVCRVGNGLHSIIDKVRGFCSA